MSIYRVSPIGGGSGFKVHVADDAGGVRVIGIFPTATNAEAWIATDRGEDSRTERDLAWQRAPGA
jgi:hypothetical protein